MAHIATNTIGAIIDHYADVIEGGNAYNSGSSYLGIPGTYSRDPGLLRGDDTPLTATAAGNTTTIEIASTYSWASNRWVRDDVPNFWLLCTSGATSAVNEARRITAWNNTTKRFTCDAFPEAPGDAAEFDVLQGFKRLPNTVDPFAEDTESPGGYDRRFHITLTPQAPRDWYGAGTETWDGELAVTLRLLKHARMHNAKQSVAENLGILASAMTLSASPDHRDSTYVRALLRPTEAAEIVTEDQHKIVAALRFPIIYRVQRGF